MPESLKLRAGVLAAKEWLAAERKKLRQQHDAGSPGIQVCAHLTEMLDKVVLNLYDAAVSDFPEHSARYRSDVALVALGGYGRGDVAPYSDIDLMILHEWSLGPIIEPLAKRMLHDLYDVGFALGQSVRHPTEACKLAMKDATIYTSLVESRFLTGSQALYERFHRRFLRATRRHWRGLIKAIERARGEERSQFGETVYLLEPNVKRSPGALRDIQLMRWLGFARYGEADPESLQMMQAILKSDQRAIRRASEFLLHTRNELHFFAGKAHDVLDRAEQVRIAEEFKFTGTEGLLPVEQFMREYFRHTREVSQLVGRFWGQIRPWASISDWLLPVVGHQMEGDFIIGPRIKATKRGLVKLQNDLTETLRLAELANLYDKRVAPSTWQAIHEAAPSFSDQLTSDGAARFLSLLSKPNRLGPLLRELHDVGVLEKVVPEFSHARCLLQFNEYHKYTVDEHSLRAVEEVTRFAEDPGLLGEVYRGLQQKRLLHLALLIHDLGKGFVEDHSEIGLRIAEHTARRLRLPESEAETLKFLVHKHLMMSHLAFRRDTSDDQVIVNFAVEVGSPDVLRMLYLLTAADLAAVGPGVLNEWKSEVLADMYLRTMRHLAGDSPSASAEEVRGELLTLLRGEPDFDWFQGQIASLPSSLLFSMPTESLSEQLRELRTLPKGEIRVDSRFLSETGTVEFLVATHETIAPGVFHKLTGGLTSAGLEILAADINTLANGLVLDMFVVRDPDYSGPPPVDRIEQIRRRLQDSLTADAWPAFRKVWSSVNQQRREALNVLPTRVQIDNRFSDHCTIIDVFASDRTGLLYTIARTIFELGLSVSLAKIGTYLDQVVDVFYVTDQAGRKIDDDARLEEVRNRLLEAITTFDKAGSETTARL